MAWFSRKDQDKTRLEVPRTLALRVALGAVACLALMAAFVGAIMSIQINWEFAQAMGRNAQAGWSLAVLLAAIEGSRILMPFIRKGLELAGMRSWARAARWAFIIFTCVSVASAFGYFALNRADATAQRGAQIARSKGFQADLAAITQSLERNAAVRSVAEIDAEIDSLPKNAPRRAELKIERAAADQREKDRKALRDFSHAQDWGVAVSGAKDEQTALIVGAIKALPWISADRADIQALVTTCIFLATILALELLVGVTPFAAIMVLVWACRRPEDADMHEHLRDRPPKGGGGERNSSATEHWNGSGNNRRSPIARKTPKEALVDLRQLMDGGVDIPSQKWLAERWGWSETRVSRHKDEWQANGSIRVRRNGRGKCNAILPPNVVPLNGTA